MAENSMKEKLRERMPIIYAELIKKGQKTMEEVPAELVPQVETILNPVRMSKTKKSKK